MLLPITIYEVISGLWSVRLAVDGPGIGYGMMDGTLQNMYRMASQEENPFLAQLDHVYEILDTILLFSSIQRISSSLLFP